MRHDPASAAVVIMLKSLKMHGMAQAVGDLTEQGSPAFEAAIPILSQLLKAETAEREVRSMAYQLKAARFPAYRDLNGFDFASSEVNEALVRQLCRCEFIEQAHNAVFLLSTRNDSCVYSPRLRLRLKVASKTRILAPIFYAQESRQWRTKYQKTH